MADSVSIIPDISVIIATYNIEKYIERAILSILDQQDVKVEIILIDDASKDKTVEIAANIRDPRIKIIRHSVNAGPSCARNAGLNAATSSWIAILDGDDVLKPGRLAHCLKRIKETKADIIVDNLEAHEEASGKIYPMFKAEDFENKHTLNLETFIKGNSSFFGGVSLGYLKPMYSVEFLRKHHLNYDPDLRIGEDYMLLAEALACGAKCTVELTPGYIYTIRSGSISHRLTHQDVLRIKNSDTKFLSLYKLTAVELKAQKIRQRKLEQAFLFTQLVDTLKQKKLLSAVKIIAHNPGIAFLLWMPASNRLKKIFNVN